MKKLLFPILFLVLSFVDSIYGQSILWHKLSLSGSQYDPQDLAYDGKLYAAMQDGLFWSSDSGNTWNTTKEFEHEAVYNVFSIDSSDYATTIPHYVTDVFVLSRSKDHGHTWDSLQWISTGNFYPTTRGCGQIDWTGDFYWFSQGTWYSLDTSFSPLWYYNAAASDDLLVALRNARSGKQLVTTTDFKTWNNGVIPDSSMWYLAVDGKTIWAGATSGLYRSNDGGIQWELVMPNYPVKSLFSSHNVLAAGSDSGVLLSFDHGKRWISGNQGLPRFQIKEFVVGDGVMYAGLDSTIYRAFVPTVSVSHEDSRTGRINLYPNPTSGLITLKCSSLPASIVIINPVGNIIMTTMLTEPSEQLDLHELPSGIYVIKIGSSNESYLGKIVVDR